MKVFPFNSVPCVGAVCFTSFIIALNRRYNVGFKIKYKTDPADFADWMAFLTSTQLAFTCSKLTIETLEQGVRYSKLKTKTPEWRHCGKTQFQDSFGQFTRNYAETVPFHNSIVLLSLIFLLIQLSQPTSFWCLYC